MAKTQNPSMSNDRFDGFSMPFLRNFVGNDLDKIILCLVWLYLKKTRIFSLDCRQLFISSGWTKNKVSKSIIFFWLCEVIKRVYQSSEEDSFHCY